MGNCDSFCPDKENSELRDQYFLHNKICEDKGIYLTYK